MSNPGSGREPPLCKAPIHSILHLINLPSFYLPPFHPSFSPSSIFPSSLLPLAPFYHFSFPSPSPFLSPSFLFFFFPLSILPFLPPFLILAILMDVK